MSSSVRIAVAQSRVELDIAANGEEIRRLTSSAATAGARIVVFPEGALSAYVGPWRREFSGWNVDWTALESELKAVAAHARTVGVWIIVGSHWLTDDDEKPRNSLFVIDDTGTVVDRYDKRRLSVEEAAVWYSPGSNPVVVDVDGLRIGCATCIELTHPDLFDDYAADGVDAFVVCAFTDDPVYVELAERHAAAHGCWCLLAQPTNCGVPSVVIDPSGHVTGRSDGTSPVILADLVPSLPDKQ